MTAAPKSRGVVDTFAIPARPLSSSSTAMSVNVPPMSTPIRHPIARAPSRSAPAAQMPREDPVKTIPMPIVLPRPARGAPAAGLLYSP